MNEHACFVDDILKDTVNKMALPWIYVTALDFQAKMSLWDVGFAQRESSRCMRMLIVCGEIKNFEREANL
jgi:hypothetical protein